MCCALYGSLRKSPKRFDIFPRFDHSFPVNTVICALQVGVDLQKWFRPLLDNFYITLPVDPISEGLLFFLAHSVGGALNWGLGTPPHGLHIFSRLNLFLKCYSNIPFLFQVSIHLLSVQYSKNFQHVSINAKMSHILGIKQNIFEHRNVHAKKFRFPSLFPISNEMIYSFLLYNINLTICDSLKEKCVVKCNVNILKQDRNKLPMVHNGHDIIHSQITKISRH